uniref:Uncharacterized protein n=1 Tax=Monodelphis domestica TaxID=13616 RepID=F6Q640_MONDO
MSNPSNISAKKTPNKELIPLITFVSFAGLGATYMSVYSLFKTDVIVNRKKNPEQWENVNPHEAQKVSLMLYSSLKSCLHPEGVSYSLSQLS